MRRSIFISQCALVGWTAALGIYLVPRLSLACSFPSPTVHVIDPEEAELDDSVPAKVTHFRVSKIRRGTGPDCKLFGSCQSTSCDDLGSVTFTIEAPQDDRSHPEEMGYFFEVLEGDPPQGLGLGTVDEPIRTTDGSVRFSWIDGSTDDQEAIDFSVIVYAMDLGGNIGEPSEILHVTHPGRTSGCAVGRVQSNLWLWALATLFIHRVRRRSYRKPLLQTAKK